MLRDLYIAHPTNENAVWHVGRLRRYRRYASGLLLLALVYVIAWLLTRGHASYDAYRPSMMALATVLGGAAANVLAASADVRRYILHEFVPRKEVLRLERMVLSAYRSNGGPNPYYCSLGLFELQRYADQFNAEGPEDANTLH